MKRRVMVLPLVLLVMVLAAAGCSAAAEQVVEEPEPTAVDEKASQTTASEEMMAEGSEEAMSDEGEAMDEQVEEPMVESTQESMAEATEESMAEATEESMAKVTEETMAEATEKSMAEATEESMAEATEESMAEGGDEMMEHEMAVLSLDFAGLEDLGQEWSYEGWIIVDGAPVSTGVFTVDGEGMASAYDFEVDAEQLAAAELFVLTVEPVPDPDPAPNQVHILAGVFEDASAGLSIAHPAALGTDFASAAGSTYSLGIPSSGMVDDSYTSGIWFDGLNLPELPAGWVYEGWVVGMEGPISTGRFASASGADSDGTGPTAGPNPGPAIPGQDFLDPAVFLTDGYVVVISVEPDPDNSTAPFTLKPLVDMNIEDEGDHGSQELTYSSDSFPTGTAYREMN